MKPTFFFIFICIHAFLYSSGDTRPTGARSMGTGSVSVSLTDAWTCFNNQAGLDLFRKPAAGISYENRFLLKELGIKSFASCLPVKGGTFGLSISSFGYSLYRENRYGLAFSKAFGDVLSFGIQLDYFSIAQAEGYGRKNTATVEFGILSKPNKNLTVGAHVFNPHAKSLDKSTNERIPTLFKAGFGYRFSEKVCLAAEAEKNMQYSIRIKTGIEYSPFHDFFLRIGISSGPSKNYMGFGWKKNHLVFDIATSFQAATGFSTQASLSYEFN